MVKNYKMITFTWCDWSGKSSIIKELQKSTPYNTMLYTHYYSLVPMRPKLKKLNHAEVNIAKPVKWSMIWVLKEIVYSIVFFFYILFIYHIKKRKLIKIVHFDINNKTDVEITHSLFLQYEEQQFFKNGNKKGKPYSIEEYYFFSNGMNCYEFVEKYPELKQFKSYVKLIIEDGTRYDKQFLLRNLDKK